MNRATSLNAPDPVISDEASVFLALPKWATPSTTAPVRSAILASGSRACRTSRLTWLSRVSLIADISGSITTRATSRSLMACSSSLLSAGRLSITDSPSTTCTSARYTRLVSAPAAMSRGAMVCFHESSTATTITARGRPQNAPGRSPRDVLAATQIVSPSLTASCMHAAFDVVVILKPGGSSRKSGVLVTGGQAAESWGCPLGRSGGAGDNVPDVAEGRPYPEGQRDLHDAVDDQPDTEHEGQG